MHEREPSLAFFKLDTGVHKSTAEIFHIKWFPTVALFRGCDKLAQLEGSMDSSELEFLIEDMLG